jgi:hypothetical protein
MIFEARYKDRPAVGIASGRLSALFLPGDGGKLASLRDAQGREYMAQAPGEVYLPLAYDDSYVDSECSGFDDMFPTIDPFTRDGVHYPDHGEVCRMPLECRVADGCIELCASSRAFGYRFEKRVSTLDGGLRLHYRIENRGDARLPCLWAAHCMLAGEDGAEPIAPYPHGADRKMMFGEVGGSTYKYYYTQAMNDGYCGCHYPARGSSVMFRFDAKTIPHLGVWINNGGFKGMRCIALEPCTALYDQPGDQALPPGGEMEFSMDISIE